MRNYLKKYPLILALIAFVLGEIGTSVFSRQMGMWSVLIGRLLLSTIMIGILVYFAGKTSIQCEKGAIGISLKKSRYILIIGLSLGLFTCIPELIGGSLVSNIPIVLVGSLLMSLSVGVFEESLYRGIIFSAFLRSMGKTRNGILKAAILSAFIFGFAHVYLELFKGNISGSLLTQVLLKTVQAGLFGFFLAALYLKTKSIWGIALVHGLYDFFSVSSSYLTNSDIGASYVGASNLQSLLYVVTILLIIPLAVKGNRMIKELDLPQRGIFY